MDMSETAGIIVNGLTLLYFAYTDVRRKNVNLLIIILQGVVNLVLAYLSGHGIYNIAMGLIPGTVAVGTSLLTRGRLGIGDGLILMALGAFFGVGDALWIWFIALCIAAVTGVVLMLLKKAGYKTALPFVPFIFAGFMLCEVGGML